MKSEWKISHCHTCGETFIQVYRLRDVNGVDHQGNREYLSKIFDTDEEAQAVVDIMNLSVDIVNRYKEEES